MADYQTALRSIQFQTTNDNPRRRRPSSSRSTTATWTRNLATKNLAITPVNDAPTLTTSAGSAAFMEDTSGPVAVDPNLTLTDPDSAQIAGRDGLDHAGFNSSEDELVFVEHGDITGAYNSGTGVLTLSGDDTVANYQTRCGRSSTTTRTRSAPTPRPARSSFQATDAESAAEQHRDAGRRRSRRQRRARRHHTAGSTPYTEGDPATTIDSGVTVTDQDDTNIEGGQVRISSGFQTGDDLVFVNQNGITGNYTAGTGVLTLTGTSSVANYQTALRSIQYQSTNNNPVTSKTVEFKVNDGDVGLEPRDQGDRGHAGQQRAAGRHAGGALSYTENDPATAVDTGLTVDDPENDNLSGGVGVDHRELPGRPGLPELDRQQPGRQHHAGQHQLEPADDRADRPRHRGELPGGAAGGHVPERQREPVERDPHRDVQRDGPAGPDRLGHARRSRSRPSTTRRSRSTTPRPCSRTPRRTIIPVLTNDTDVDGGPKTISSRPPTRPTARSC